MVTAKQHPQVSGGAAPAYRLPPLAPTGELEVGDFLSAEGAGPEGSAWSMRRERARVAWWVRTRGGKRLSDTAPDQYAAARAIYIALGVPLPSAAPALSVGLVRVTAERDALLEVIGARTVGEAPFIVASLRDRAEAAERRVRELEAEVGQLRAERV